MHIHVLQEPLEIGQFYREGQIVVLPILFTADQSSLFEDIAADEEYRIGFIRDYLRARNVNFFTMPDNIAVLAINVAEKYRYKYIMENIERIYKAFVKSDFRNFDCKKAGIEKLNLYAALGNPFCCYTRLPKRREHIIVHTGNPRFDEILLRHIRQGGFDTYTASTLIHPTVRGSLERKLLAVGKRHGFDCIVDQIVRFGKKVLITCDLMNLNGEAG